MVKAKSLREYKLMLIGAAVGKTAITVCFVEGSWVAEYDPMIETPSRKQCVIDKEVVTLDVQPQGRDEHGALREVFLRKGDGFLLVYDITSRNSFQEILAFHQQILQVKDQDSVPIILIGNKSDLGHERRVTMHEGSELAKRLGCKFFETSVKESTNVHEAFGKLIRETHDRQKEHERSKNRGSGAYRTRDSNDDTPRCCSGCVVL